MKEQVKKAEMVTGAYTDYRCAISKEELGIFEEALDGLLGVEYKPVAVATQVVAGENLSFFCNAKGVYPGSMWVPAMVDIYNPLPGQGKPVITNIHIIQR